MIRLAERLSEWDGALPALLALERVTPEQRREALRVLVARTLKAPLDRVAVEHGEGRPPRVAAPLGSGLYLSSASRGRFAVLAVARAPIGVDVEVATAELEIPWRVLHPIEAEALKLLHGSEQRRAFARIWSIKEAYLKARGLGFAREPAGFVVHGLADERALITDPQAEDEVAEASTQWRGLPEGWAAISTVVLARAG